MTMKQMLIKQAENFRKQWMTNVPLRCLVLVSVPILLLGLWLGGLRTAMLLTGYLQLVFRAFLPGEPVENKPLQRAAAFAASMARMLFFTGMMTAAAWPLLLMAGAQTAGLIILAYAERTGTELSLLPLLASSGFAALGVLAGIRYPAVGAALSAALTLTLLYLLLHGKENWNQLRMRFHLT